MFQGEGTQHESSVFRVSRVPKPTVKTDVKTCPPSPTVVLNRRLRQGTTRTLWVGGHSTRPCLPTLRQKGRNPLESEFLKDKGGTLKHSLPGKRKRRDISLSELTLLD